MIVDGADLLAERELEVALVTRLQELLLELGHGFAFVGRQHRFVVVELSGPTPAHAGQPGFYVAWVDENMHLPGAHAPTVGILLCTSRSDNVVRYSLAGGAPMAVAGYTYDALPASVRDAVPTDVELSAATAAVLTERTDEQP